jgi:hypothetical protein
MPQVVVQPNGKMEFIRTKHKPKSSRNHQSDSRDQKIAELQRQVDELEDQKEQLINQYHSVKELKKQAVDDAKSIKQVAIKYKQELEETQDKYEDLNARFERRSEEIKQKDKVIRQRESDIRQKDKELEELRIDKKVQNGTIKKLEDQDVALREKATVLMDEKRRQLQEISLRKANEERQLAENKKLKEENTRLLDWVARERQLALERETRLRREREETDRRDAERRDAERRAPRARFDDEFLDGARFARPMPARPRNRWDSD